MLGKLGICVCVVFGTHRGVPVMQEFTGLGRAEAIEMLYQFGGDPNAVMAHLFP